MLHRFLARVCAAGCRRGHATQLQFVGFQFRCELSLFGCVSLAFYLHLGSAQQLEKAVEVGAVIGEVCRGEAETSSSRSVCAHCPLKLQVMMLGCLSVSSRLSGP